MSYVDVNSMRKTLGGNLILSDVTFGVEEGTILTLLGPSGCGKSTTLKCVAGLESPDSGTIRIGDQQVVGSGKPVPTNKRNLGMVFQSYALWPHMTVHENVAFALRVRKSPAARTRELVRSALELVGLDKHAESYPAQLSGGQQQRVSLARALVYQPRVILLDEPLSNLDAKLRDQMRREIVRIQREAGITAIYVTHDRTEALSMSDRMCVMRGGRIVQNDTPDVVWNAPRSRYVADFLGMLGLLRCTWEGASGETATASIGGTRIGVQLDPAVRAYVANDPDPSVLVDVSRLAIVVRPDAERQAGGNRLHGTVLSNVVVGDHVELELDVAGQVLKLRRERVRMPELAAGQMVGLDFPVDAARILPADDSPPVMDEHIA